MNRFILTIGTAVLFCSSNLSAQVNSVDSLKNALTRVNGTEKIATQLRLSIELKYSNPSEALKYAENALVLSRELENDSLIVHSLFKIAVLNDHLDKDAQALSQYLEVLRIYRDKDIALNQAITLFNLGSLYYYQDNYPKSLNYFYKALKIFDRLNARDRASTTLMRIGMVFQKRGEPEKAIEYYMKALDENTNKGDNSTAAQISTAIADSYFSLGDKKNAIYFLEKALGYSKKLPGKPGKHAIAMILMEISSIYKSQNSYEQALAFNDDALEVAKIMDNKLLVALSYENRAHIFADQKKYETSNFFLKKSIALLEEARFRTQVSHNRLFLSQNYFALEKYKKSIAQAFIVKKYAEKENKPELKKDALQQLVASQIAVKNYKEALKRQKELLAVKDSLYAQEKTEQIAKMQIRYETQKKEQEIALLEKKHEKATLLRNALFVGLFLLITIAFLIFNRQRLKLVKNKTNLENTRLKQQQLKQDLKFKNKQLTTHSLNLVQKNEVMKELKQRIAELQNQKGDNNSHLNGLSHLIDYSFNLDKDWEEFKLYFEKVHIGFFDALKDRFPDLTTSEMRLSALVKLNLTIKEVATIMSISPDSVKTARYRLRKKLRLETDENLSDFLHQIEHDVTSSS